MMQKMFSYGGILLFAGAAVLVTPGFGQAQHRGGDPVGGARIGCAHVGGCHGASILQPAWITKNDSEHVARWAPLLSEPRWAHDSAITPHIGA
jgi:hypothetical protein